MSQTAYIPSLNGPRVELFIDTSGKAHEHSVVVAAGYIALPEQWSSFSETWNGLLARAGIPFFHATSFFSRTKECKHFDRRDPTYQELAHAFASAVYVHLPQGHAFAVEVAPFVEILQPLYEPLTTPHGRVTPEMEAIFRVCGMAISRETMSQDVRVWLYIEDGKGSGEALSFLKGLKAAGEPVLQHIVSFETAPKNTIPLQAADFLANETFREASLVVADNDRVWEDVERTTFKVLTIGSADRHPTDGTSKVTILRAGHENFRHDVPALADFMRSRPQYRKKSSR